MLKNLEAPESSLKNWLKLETFDGIYKKSIKNRLESTEKIIQKSRYQFPKYQTKPQEYENWIRFQVHQESKRIRNNPSKKHPKNQNNGKAYKKNPQKWSNPGLSIGQKSQLIPNSGKESLNNHKALKNLEKWTNPASIIG